MSSLQSPGSFSKSFGNLSFAYSNRKLRVLLHDRQVGPDSFGVISRNLNEVPRHSLQEILNSVDEERGGLTPEQEELLQNADPCRIIQTCEDEYAITGGQAEHIAWALPKIFVRAYPMAPALKIKVDYTYDGFYGPVNMSPPLPLELEENNVRDFMKAVFGEHRRSFARFAIEANSADFAAVAYLASLIQNPDLMQEVLEVRTDFKNSEVLTFTKRSDLSKLLRSLRKSTLKNLLMDAEDARDSVVSDLVETAELLDSGSLKSIRASGWDDLLIKAVKTPSSRDCAFMPPKDSSKLHGARIHGYEFRILEDRLSLAYTAQSLKNCLFEAKYTLRAADGHSMYFALMKGGIVVGAVELRYIRSKWVVLQLEGPANSVLPEHSEIETQIASLMTPREVS